MRDEFGSSLSNVGVNILDPFTGTGTFISRLLQSEIFSTDQRGYVRRSFGYRSTTSRKRCPDYRCEHG